MARIFIVFFVFLTGCSPSMVASTPRSVTMGNVASFNIGKAQVQAERECLKYGRHAIHRPDSQRDGIVTFECVE